MTPWTATTACGCRVSTGCYSCRTGHFMEHTVVLLYTGWLFHKKKDSPQQVVIFEKYDTSYHMTHGHSLVVGYFQKYGLHTINTIWWKLNLYIIIFQCVFINERIWQRGRKHGRAVLFKREQRVCDALWGRIRDHILVPTLTFCCCRTTRCIRV